MLLTKQESVCYYLSVFRDIRTNSRSFPLDQLNTCAWFVLTYESNIKLCSYKLTLWSISYFECRNKKLSCWCCICLIHWGYAVLNLCYNVDLRLWIRCDHKLNSLVISWNNIYRSSNRLCIEYILFKAHIANSIVI